jgi:hypothetical protein
MRSRLVSSAVGLVLFGSLALLDRSDWFVRTVLAAAAYDTVASGTVNTPATSIGSFNINIGAGVTNGVVVVGIVHNVNTTTSDAVTVGGNAASLVTGTDSTTNKTGRSMIFCYATGSTTGNVAVVASWTNNAGGVAGAMSFSGADQTTPCANGGFTGYTTDGSGNPNPYTHAVTSTSGDTSLVYTECAGGTTPTAPTQTERYGGAVISGDFLTRLSASTATGGTATHGWTTTSFKDCTLSGVNIAQVASAAAPRTPCLPLLGVSCQ